MQQIKFTANGSNSELGNFSAGDTGRVSPAMAKHLVEEVGCATYVGGAPVERASTTVVTKATTPADPGKLTVAELKASLDAAGIAYPADAKKPDLVALYPVA